MDEYSKNEANLMFKIIDEKLDAIVSQTTRTNGRCSKLEDEVTLLQSWQSTIKGGLAVLTAVILPTVIYTINQFVNHK